MKKNHYSKPIIVEYTTNYQLLAGSPPREGSTTSEGYVPGTDTDISNEGSPISGASARFIWNDFVDPQDIEDKIYPDNP